MYVQENMGSRFQEVIVISVIGGCVYFRGCMHVFVVLVIFIFVLTCGVFIGLFFNYYLIGLGKGMTARSDLLGDKIVWW
jgi:hypothetical protein